jgi:hypothetical protein
LKDQDNELLFQILDERVLGFKEILMILGKRSLDIADLHIELSIILGNNVKWSNNYQTLVRAGWLQSMKFITKEKNVYILTELGKKLLSKSANMMVETKILDPVIKTRPETILVTETDIIQQTEPISHMVTHVTETCDEVSVIINDLVGSEHAASNPDMYEEAITNAFAYLGFDSKHIGKAGHTDVLAIAPLGSTLKYTITIDGKSSSNDKIPQRQISWDSLNEHKNENHADYAVVVAPGFAGGDMLERAKKHDVLLVETKSLIELGSKQHLHMAGLLQNKTSPSTTLSFCRKAAYHLSLCSLFWEYSSTSCSIFQSGTENESAKNLCCKLTSCTIKHQTWD